MIFEEVVASKFEKRRDNRAAFHHQSPVEQPEDESNK